MKLQDVSRFDSPLLISFEEFCQIRTALAESIALADALLKQNEERTGFAMGDWLKVTTEGHQKVLNLMKFE